MATKSHVLSLYKRLLREGAKFDNYNYRMYILRRVRDAFHENKGESEPEKVTSMLEKAYKNLEIVKRQVVLGQLYSQQKMVIEVNK